MPLITTQEEFSKSLETIGVDPSLKLGSPAATRELLKPIGVIKSDDGIYSLTRAGETLRKLSPAPQQQQPEKPQEKTPAAPKELDFINFIHPETEQSSRVDNPHINREAIEQLTRQGYQVAEQRLSSPLPFTVTSTGTQATPPTPIDTAKRDYEDTIAKLQTFDTSQDPALQSIVRGIEGRWETRIRDMEQINKSRVAALTTTGIRLGSRYTGRMFEGIITEEEKQGASRIADLEAQKQMAISEARQAYDTKQWNKYVQLANFAEKAYSKQLDTVKDLNKIQAEQDKELRQNIAEEKKARTTTISGILKDLGENNAPSSIISAVGAIAAAGGSVSDAILATGSWFKKVKDPQNLPASVLEYQFDSGQRKAAGLPERSYDEWLTVDTNRKARIAAAASLGTLTSAQSSLVNSISASFENSPLVKNFIETQNRYQNVLRNVGQGDGAADIAYIFDLMKVLDPNSVVRETEYATGARDSGNIFKGYMARFNGMIDPKGGFVSEEAKNNILGVIGRRFETAKSQYENLRKEKIKSLENRGVKDADQFLTEYDFENPLNETKRGIQGGQDATQRIAIFQNASPENAQKVRELSEIAPNATAEEIVAQLDL